VRKREEIEGDGEGPKYRKGRNRAEGRGEIREGIFVLVLVPGYDPT